MGSFTHTHVHTDPRMSVDEVHLHIQTCKFAHVCMCIRFTATGDSTAHGGGRDLSTTDAPTPCDRLAALLLAPRSLQHPPYTRPALWLLSLAPVSSQLSEFSSLSSSPPDPSSSPLSPPSSLPAPPSSLPAPPSSPLSPPSVAAFLAAGSVFHAAVSLNLD